MSKRTNFFSGVALSLYLSFPAGADVAPTAQTIVATVNGTDITLGHMILVRSELSPQYTNLSAEVLYRGILDQLIQQTMLAQVHEGEVPTRITVLLENEKRSLLAALAIDGILSGPVSEDKVLAAYEKTYGGATPEREYKAAHILVDETDLELANDLIMQLADGADFAKLAKENSTGPSGPNGGDLGWFGAGMMVKPFEDAVVAMKSGDVSDPVKTKFGWHIIKLIEIRLTEAPALNEVRGGLEEGIQRQAVTDQIEKMLQSADIVQPEDGFIDPELLSQIGLLED